MKAFLGDRYAFWLYLKSLYHSFPLPMVVKRLLLRQTVRFRRSFLFAGLMAFPEPLAESADLLQAIQTLSIQSSDRPVVSIIIPCYDQLRYTVQCLLSIQRIRPHVDLEVIVVDDASPSDDYSAFVSVPGVRVLANSTNMGFIGSCNAGASIARGQYLYFLNNDTCLLAGAIDELLTTLRLFPQCGIAGSQLLYPNGKLQEAGAELSPDGTAVNIGRFDDPHHSRYQYLRVVDYCSGASVMVRRDQFLGLGGFDPYFSPAYYEDADLSMRYRERGLFTLYQPLSRVVHYEGISNGRDESHGIKAHQIANQSRFSSRWHDVLSTLVPLNEDLGFSLPRNTVGRVLVITNQIPCPDIDAGSICELNLMLLLRAAGWHPVLFVEHGASRESGYAQQLCQGLGIELVTPTAVSGLRSWLRQRGDGFDLAVLFRPETCHERLQIVRRYCAKAKILYYPHDLHYLRFEREAYVLSSLDCLKRAGQYRAIEHENSRLSDLTVLLSEDERTILASDLPGVCVATLPLVLSDAPTGLLRVESDCARNIVFVGNFSHSPNRDAVRFFLADVFPFIVAGRPDAVFHVVGSSPPPDIVSMNGPSVRIHGFVEDLDLYLSGMDVSVLPLRYGAGVKGKLGVSLRAGVPVVSTHLGVEGVPLKAGKHALLADRPDTFAEAVLALLDDPALRSSLRTAGQSLFAEHWGSRRAYRQLLDLLSALGLSGHSEPNQDPIPLLPFPRSHWPGSHAHR